MKLAGWPNRAAPALLCAALACACGRPTPAVAPASPSLTPTQQLVRDLDSALAAPELRQGTWGVLVKSLARDEILYATNSGKLLLPSSTMKVLTLAAAADRMGWDFTYETRLVGGGGLTDGILGSLTVVGGGDPSLDNWDGKASRLFQEWAGRLKAAGVRSIAGDLIGDDNAFDDEPLGSGWMWDDLDRSFATGIGALQFNENTAQVTIAPGASIGEPALITAAPPSAGLRLRSQVVTGAAGSASEITAERKLGDPALDIRGSIPLGGTPIVRNVSVLNPTLYFLDELKSALVTSGVEVRGNAADIDDIPGGPPPPGGETLVDYRSLPLSTLAATMMKLSQNLYAETLLKTMGLSQHTPTAEAGLGVVRSVLSSWGIPESGYVQADGSGLSRYNYVTAETLVAVLTHVNGDARLRGPFVAALPLAGRDGTLENRMKGTAAEGNAHAKTGSMTNARALAGYVSSADGEPLVFAILANNFGTSAEAVDRTVDALVVRLAEFSREPHRVPAAAGR